MSRGSTIGGKNKGGHPASTVRIAWWVKTYGDQLHELREKADVSVSKLARALDMSETHIRQVEANLRGPLSLDATRLAAACIGVSPESLVGAYVTQRGYVSLVAHGEQRKAVALRLAVTWDLLTDDELGALGQTLDGLRAADGTRRAKT